VNGDGHDFLPGQLSRGDSGGPSRYFYCAKASREEREIGCENLPAKTGAEAVGRKEGSAGLTPRAGAGRTAADIRNHHPTVKPLALMRWLARLVTPPGGVVLDHYLGSGTTALACMHEGFRCIGFELDPAHVAIAKARIVAVVGGESPRPVIPTRGQISMFGGAP
jgi:site-specific DNA-methyltransferase (adenine-specific)